jgi:hypothetical protein
MVERQINVRAFLILQEWRKEYDDHRRERLEHIFYDLLKHNWPREHSGNGMTGIRAYMEEYDAE